MLKLARRLVLHPRHRTLRAADWDDFNQFRRRVEELVPKETWKEVERLLKTNERYTVSLGPKTGNGRRPGRESKSSLLCTPFPDLLERADRLPFFFLLSQDFRDSALSGIS